MNVMDERVESWKRQWSEDPEYNTYKPSEVEILKIDDMLFLIPKGEKQTKPIKVIIA